MIHVWRAEAMFWHVDGINWAYRTRLNLFYDAIIQESVFRVSFILSKLRIQV